MAKGEAKALAAAYRSAFRDALVAFEEPALLALRGELQVAARWFGKRKDDDGRAAAEAALDAVTRLHEFTVVIRGFDRSRRSAEQASLFDLGAIGVLAVENLLTAEKITPMRLLMNGLSEALVFLGSRQYVHGGDAVLDATFRAHRVVVQDSLWAAAVDFRDPKDLAGLREARSTLDEAFRRIDGPGVSIAAKVATLHVLATLVAIVRCLRVLEVLDGRA